MEKILEQEKIWREMIFPTDKKEFIKSLYLKYKDDLKKVKKDQHEFYSVKDSIGLVPQLGDMEAEITYLLIREYKPNTIVEISPASGWSTSWILNALKDNGLGNLYSYDLVDDSTKTIPLLLSNSRWNFIKGDIKKNIHLLPEKIDYLFIDSDHSANFAMWYIQNLLSNKGENIKVSVHDILKNSNEPGWGEESNILCSWLVENEVPCMTASRALKDKGYSEFLELRKKIGLDAIIHAPDYNSMIYFNL